MSPPRRPQPLSLESVVRAAHAVLQARRGARRGARSGHPTRDAAELAEAVHAVSLAYRRQAGAPADLVGKQAALDARLSFFMPRDFKKVELPLRELRAAHALPRAPQMRVLDLGAGLFTTGLATASFVLASGHAEHVHIDAVDSDSSALAIGQQLATQLVAQERLALSWHARAEPLLRVIDAPAGPSYSLIVLGFVLNELSSVDTTAMLCRLCERLTPDGALIVLEPALRQTSRALQATRDALVAARAASQSGPTVFAPCLHTRPCPLLERERDWCHERIAISLPAELAELARAAGLREEDLTFSYLTLRRDSRRLVELSQASPGDEIPPTVPLHRVVGGPLVSKGKREWSVCGTDTTRTLRLLDRAVSADNDALLNARRGSVVAVEHGRQAAGSACVIDATSTVRIVHAS